MRDLGFDNVLNLSLTEPGTARAAADPGGRRSPRADRASATRSRSSTRCCARRCSARCSTSAAYNLARGAGRVALFESGRALPARGLLAGGWHSGRRVRGRAAAPAFEPQRIGCLAVGPAGRARLARRGAAGATSSRSRAALEALAEQLGAELAVEPTDEPFLAPGPRGRGPPGRSPGRLARRDPSAGAAGMGDRGRGAAGFEIDLAELVGASQAGLERYERRDRIPGRVPGPGGGGRRRRSGGARPGRGAGGRRRAAAAGARLRPLHAASRSARGARAWRCGSSSARPTAP